MIKQGLKGRQKPVLQQLGLKYGVMGFSGATGMDFDSNPARNRLFVADQASGTLRIITELVS
jgi:hypothetical protein